MTRFLDPAEVTASLPNDWVEVDRRLFPKDTGIWLIELDRSGTTP